MAFDVSIKLKKKFSVAADKETTFQLLSNVPASTNHFPDLDKLVQEATNTFRWEMKKISLGPISLQTIYACEYSSDPDTHKISWVPRKTDGENAIVTGEWILEESESGCDITLLTDAKMTIPLPSLAGIGLKPVVRVEFETLTNTYIKNLTKALSASEVTA